MKKLINLECKKCRANLSEDENKGIFFVNIVEQK